MGVGVSVTAGDIWSNGHRYAPSRFPPVVGNNPAVRCKPPGALAVALVSQLMLRVGSAVAVGVGVGVRVDAWCGATIGSSACAGLPHGHRTQIEATASMDKITQGL